MFLLLLTAFARGKTVPFEEFLAFRLLLPLIIVVAGTEAGRRVLLIANLATLAAAIGVDARVVTEAFAMKVCGFRHGAVQMAKIQPGGGTGVFVVVERRGGLAVPDIRVLQVPFQAGADKGGFALAMPGRHHWRDGTQVPDIVLLVQGQAVEIAREGIGRRVGKRTGIDRVRCAQTGPSEGRMLC